MITLTEDPVEVLIHRFKKYAEIVALHFMTDSQIIEHGNMSIQTHPNRTVRTRFYFESLESEPDPNTLRGITRQLRLLQRSTHERFFPTVALRELQRLKSTR